MLLKFKDYYKKLKENHDEDDDAVVVPDNPNAPPLKYDISTPEGWTNQHADELIDRHNPTNMGTQEEQLASVIRAARQNFPDGSKKVCTTAGEDREWYDRLRSQPLTKRLWDLMQQEVQQGKIKITPSPDHDGEIIGEPNAVKELYDHLANRIQTHGKDWPYNPDYHRKFGQLVGYPQQHIEKFVDKIANIKKQRELNTLSK